MRCPYLELNCLKKWSPDHRTKIERCVYISARVEICCVSIECSDFTHCSFYGRNFWICPLIFDMPTSCPATPYYSSSLYILGIYALRVTLLSTRRRAFKWFAASAERKCIFNDEKLMNPAFFRCFSRFSNFSSFPWFSSDLTMKFDSVAWFPARGSFQIARAWNIKPIQIFVFI